MPDAAREIFDRVNTVDDIQAFIRIGEQEDLHIDFKTVPDVERVDAVKANFSKALSALANAEGGVIVWGVDCRLDREKKIDAASRRVPIYNVRRLLTILNDGIARATSPNVDGVKNKVIPPDEEIGYIVTLVPESDKTPHMASFGEYQHRYFKRSGGRSEPMEHFEVADMFGRRQKPKLEFVLEPERTGTIDGPGGRFFTVGFRFGLRNVGRATARCPMLELEVKPSDAYEISVYGITGNRNQGMEMQPTENHRKILFGGVNDFVHAGHVRYIGKTNEIRISQRNSQYRELECIYTIGAEGAPAFTGVTKVERQAIIDLMPEFLDF